MNNTEGGSRPPHGQQLLDDINYIFTTYCTGFKKYYDWMHRILDGIAISTNSDLFVETRPSNELRNFVDHIRLALTRPTLERANLDLARARRHIVVGIRMCLVIAMDDLNDYNGKYITEIEQILLGNAVPELRLRLGAIRSKQKDLPAWEFSVIDNIVDIESDLDLLAQIIRECHVIVKDHNDLAESLREAYPINGPFLQGWRRLSQRVKRQIVKNIAAGIVRIIAGIALLILAWLWGYYTAR
jgi:hypothetical protein